MNVFYVTPGGQIGNDYWTATKGWVSQTLPGVAKAGTAPAALANSASLMNLFYVSPDGHVVNDYWTPTRGWVSQTLPGSG